MSIFSGILDVLFPPRCTFCRRFLSHGETRICSECAEKLPYAEGPACRQKGTDFRECVSPLFYKDDVRASILRFKFKGATGYATAYGKILADCIRDTLVGEYDIITWVPISSKRELQRGYDQAMLLASAAALELGDVACETLRKATDVPAQSSLAQYEERRSNVAGVYEVVDKELIAGMRILLIDDIITTGATLSECARALVSGGAAGVVCAALARSEKPIRN